MKIKNISENSLYELLSLIEQIDNRIKQYSHVSQYLPNSLTKEIDEFYKKLTDEYNNRID
jgi:glutathionyl-hydroquinone reductase